MGVLIDGAWRDGELPQETGASGEFRRSDSRFRERITADGSSGFKAEAGRYHLYVAHGCPWAHRTLIYRSVKKLQGAITVAYSVPGLRQQGWTFADDPAFPDCTPDGVNGFRYLHQAYTATDPHYTGKVTVPTLWDTKTQRIVNNESPDIIRMLNSEFDGIGGDGAHALAPPGHEPDSPDGGRQNSRPAPCRRRRRGQADSRMRAPLHPPNPSEVLSDRRGRRARATPGT